MINLAIDVTSLRAWKVQITLQPNLWKLRIKQFSLQDSLIKASLKDTHSSKRGYLTFT